MPGNGNGGGKPGGGGGGEESPLSLNGNRKDNVLIGGDFGDNIWGRDGNDVLIGMGDGDMLVGGEGNDILIGDSGTVENPEMEDPSSDGPDRLFGGVGNDSLYGGGGDDELQGGDDLDYLDGGSGFDIALYSADDYSITVVASETEDGDEFDGFVVTFSKVDPVIGGGPGPDTLDGAHEDARNIEGIVGTYYDDTMTGSNLRGNWFDGYYGNDSLTGGSLDDCINGGGDNDTIDGAAGNDLLYGGSGDDSIQGGTGGDTIDGGPGNDIIDGGAGMDTITGGGGADTITGGTEADTFVYLSASEGGDTINNFSGAGVGLDGDTIDLTALSLDGGGKTVAHLMAGGFIFVDGNDLYVDLDGGGPGETTDPPDSVPINDDVLIATFDGGTFNLDTDVLV